MLRQLSDPLSRADAATVALVLTELVTNAIRHGCTDPDARVGVVVSRAPGRVRLEVTQSGSLYDPAMVRRRLPGVDRGWGILILDRMSRSWGLDPQAGMVWADISVDGKPGSR